MIAPLLQRVAFRLRHKTAPAIRMAIQRLKWRALGMQIGADVQFSRMTVTWPHQVRLGAGCILEQDVFLKYDGMWCAGPAIDIGQNVFIGAGVEFNIKESIRVGRDSLIASGTKFVDHDHATALGRPMRKQTDRCAAISIGSDVWIGFNCTVLKGVTIGNGAVLAAGSVLNTSIPPNEIWAGAPARRVKARC